MSEVNESGQPVGRRLAGWDSPPMISHAVLIGRYVVLRPLQLAHAGQVYSALEGSADELWTYMPFGPFRSVSELEDTFRSLLALPDWLPYVVEVGGRVEGFESYLRITPRDGALEIGSIVYSSRLQRTTAATEAAYLLLRHAFESGYRRVEWKCDDLNEPSRRAGERLGFRYEGTFRNATHYKGRNRDTAWFAITVEEWDGIRTALEKWLDPANFDSKGQQIHSLSNLRHL